MFATFTQYLSYGFFRTNFTIESIKGKEEFPYFSDPNTSETVLRSWNNGKLKARVINGEEYPPYVEDIPEIAFHYFLVSLMTHIFF